MLDITKDIQSLTTFRRHKPHLYRVIYGVLEKRSMLKCSTSATAQGGSASRPISHKLCNLPADSQNLA